MYISYRYTRSVASKIFNYKASLQQIHFDGLSQNPTPCSCCDSEFLYAPCGHIVTGDLSIVRNQKLRDVLRKGPNYRVPVSFSWHQNLISSWTRVRGMPDGGPRKRMSKPTLFLSFFKSIADVLKRRIRRLKRSVNTRHESIYVVRELSSLHENFVIAPADKASNNYTFVCKKYYVSILIEELGLNSLPGNPT